MVSHPRHDLPTGSRPDGTAVPPNPNAGKVNVLFVFRHEAFLVFASPFYPLQGKREEIYSGFLHDVFRQIEADRILS